MYGIREYAGIRSLQEADFMDRREGNVFNRKIKHRDRGKWVVNGEIRLKTDKI